MEYKVFWCRLNKFYANQWINYFEDNNIYDKNNFLIASCEVTDRAKSKWLREVKQNINKWYNVHITWCWSIEKWNLIDKETFYKRHPELIAYKNNITLLPESPKWDNLNYIDWDKNNFTKKFVIIQNWCDTNCTFCLTIKKRGASKNREIEDIIEEIKLAEAKWAKEIVLTWINLSAWWASNTRNANESKFSYLLKTILKRTNIERIRISSLSPEFLDDMFFEIAQEKRIMPFFHFSIQSFSDKILKLMNRNYDSKRLNEVLNKTMNIKRNDGIKINLWADIIVWFPWEEEWDYIETYNWIKNYKITNLHAFPFSSHMRGEWVPASKLKNQIESSIKKERERSILNLAEKQKNEFFQSNKWKKANVLIEKVKDWYSYWWTENYIYQSIKWKYNKWEIIVKNID